MAQKKMELDITNANCAGIDVGSKSHIIAVGQALEGWLPELKNQSLNLN